MNGAIPLDDLPRPGVAISRERWLQLIAAEAEKANLRATVSDLLENHDKVYRHEQWACMEQAAERARTFLATLT